MCIHFDACDTLDKLHFKCLTLMTRNNAKIRSGEIAVLVKEHLFDYIKIVKNDIVLGKKLFLKQSLDVE